MSRSPQFGGVVPTSLVTIVLLCMSLLLPLSTSAQIDQATPISGVEPPGEGDDASSLEVSDISAAAVTASFDATSYSTTPGGSAPVILTIDVSASTFPSTYTIYNPVPGEGVLASALASVTGGAICDVSGPDVNGYLNGNFSGGASDGSCIITFSVNVDPAAILGEKNFMAAMILGVSPGPSVPFSVIAPVTSLAASFDAAAYAVDAGSSTSVNMSIEIPAGTLSSTYTISNPVPVEGSLTALPVNFTGGATCDVTGPDGSGNLTGSFSSGATGGICTIAFVVSVDSAAVPGAKNDLTAVVTGVTPDPSASFSVSTAITTLAASFDATSYAAFAGGSAPATLTIQIPAFTFSSAYTIFNPAPGEGVLVSTLASATGGASCDVNGPDINGYLYGTFSGGTTSGTCTVSFSVDVDLDATAGEKNFMAALVGGVSPGPSVPFTVVAPVTALAASFDAAAFAVDAGSSVLASLKIEIPAGTVSSTYTISNPVPGEGTLTAASTSIFGDATCNVSGPDGSGNLTGSFSGGVTNGLCTISFAVSVDAGAATGAKNDLTALVTGVTPDPSATFNVATAVTTLAASFDKTSYASVAGGTVPVTLTIDIPAFTSASTYTIYNPVPGEGALASAFASVTGGASCDVSGPDGNGYLNGTFSGGATSGICTITFLVNVDPAATLGEKNFLAALVIGLAPGPSVPFSVVGPLEVDQQITLNVQQGSMISGDLKDYITGGVPPFTFAEGIPPTQGNLVLNPDGTFTYTANIDAGSTDSFTFTVTDSQFVLTSAAVVTGTVDITITALPPSPTPSPTTETGETPTPSPTSESGETPTPSPTSESGETPTPSPTSESGETPTPTSETGETPGSTGTATPNDHGGLPANPNATHTPTAASGGSNGTGNDSGNGVTGLPSTGAGQDQPVSTTIILLLAGILLLTAATIIERRRSGTRVL